MATKLTSGGMAAGIAAASLIALGAATGDIVMGLAGAAVPLAMAADLIALRGRRAESARAEVKMEAAPAYDEEEAAAPAALKARTIAGEKFSASGTMNMKHRVRSLKAPPPFRASFAPLAAKGNDYAIRIEAQPATYGKYYAGALEATVSSPIGMLTSDAPVRLASPVELVSFPRFHPGLVRALGLLEGMDGSVSQGRRAWLARRGDDYAWSREYEPGDPDRLIDWKATARKARLCVKEFREGLGGGAWVFLDGRAPGPVTADGMAGDLLSVCAGLAEEGRDAGFACAGTAGGPMIIERAGPGELLRIAIRKAFEIAQGQEGWEGKAFALMPPKVRSQVAELLKEKGYTMENKVNDAYAEMMTRASDTPLSLAYVGCPIYEPERVLAMVEKVAECGGEASALMPAKPWADAGGVEQAYRMRESYLRVYSRMHDAARTSQVSDSGACLFPFQRGAAGAPA